MHRALERFVLLGGELEPERLARVRDRVVDEADPSIRAFISAGSASYAARMSANSVSAGTGGTTFAESIE